MSILYLGDPMATPRGLNLSMTSSIPVNTRGQSDRNGYALTRRRCANDARTACMPAKMGTTRVANTVSGEGCDPNVEPDVELARKKCLLASVTCGSCA